MKDKWSDKEALQITGELVQKGVPDILAHCIYGSNLLGRNEDLVIHGGGNASVKNVIEDLCGRPVRGIYIKSSGSDMKTVGPEEFPVLDLGSLEVLEELETLSDAQMQHVLNKAKLNTYSKRPSVETLLHVFLPAPFIFHTHASAVLAVTNQKDGKELAERIFGSNTIVLPYEMSGFGLAKKAALAVRKNTASKAIVVLKHGIFTFGDSAKEAYQNMIEIVTLAEKVLVKQKKQATSPKQESRPSISVDQLAPRLRGLIMGEQRLKGGIILDFRKNKLIHEFVCGDGLNDYANRGPVTPDHVIWTKPKPLILSSNLNAKVIRRDLKKYIKSYTQYFVKNNNKVGGGKEMNDALPKVVFVKNLGLFGIGKTALDAKVAADLAEVSVKVIFSAEKLGKYVPARPKDIFDIEYWDPEVKKLDTSPPPPLQGRIVLITGGGSGIGKATAKVFQDAGAEVVILDSDEKALREATKCIGCLGLEADVTNQVSVVAAFKKIIATYGGLDIVVSNAGAAWEGEIGEVEDSLLRKSFELNFFSHQRVAQNAVRVFKKQNNGQSLGGVILFNTSKQAINPGKGFGPYGLPKAATLFLVRQYALDHGKDGIRTGGVNADRVKSGLLTDALISRRARARGISKQEYLTGNLLGREVLAQDVAKAFLDLALSPATTGAIFTVDGGNIEAVLR